MEGTKTSTFVREGDNTMTNPTYAYDRFHRALLAQDMAFEGGPSPGQEFPDFNLPTVERGQIRKSDFVGSRPMLMVFASFT